MICVSIAEPTTDLVIKSLKNEEFAEIRLDAIENLQFGDIRRIFSVRCKFIATCRFGFYNDEQRKAFLLEAIRSGVAFVDVEVDSPEDFVSEVVRAAREKGTRVIISYHHFEKTPSSAELDQIVNWCFSSGADIAKIVCHAQDKSDCARILSLYEKTKPIIAFSMGSLGAFTRIAAPFLGAPFVYVAKAAGKETAEGQFDKKQMLAIMEKIAGV
ncbi:MAG: type I 3-dehydroquinate dehydratase [Candidatus Marinimicrobia bacterium]|nr:type I 3-dehydroquinate dehydratase [Candidatus Neomarinimicrobiota bacterium]